MALIKKFSPRRISSMRDDSMPGVHLATEDSETTQPVRQLLDRYIREPEFKRVLNRIASAQKQDGWKSLAVLSSQPGEGKTFLICAIAISYFYALRKRVLVLDTVHQTVEESFYFNSIKRNQTVDGSAIAKSPTLDVVSSRAIFNSRVDLSERIGQESRSGKKFDVADFLIGDFVRSFEDSYDLILLDTCAMQSSSAAHIDPLVLATQVDRALLVMTPESSRDDQISYTREMLSDERIHPLGAVMNEQYPLGVLGSRRRAVG